MAQQSAYDQQYLLYETRPISIQRQLDRAQFLSQNQNFVGLLAAAPIVPTQNTNPVVYPLYQLGYSPGQTVVVLPTQVANPTPIHNQHNRTSDHTYSMFTETDLPAMLFRLEPYQDIYKQGDDDIPVPVLHDAASNQPIRNTRGATLRYFSFLPRYISHDVSGALLEFWFRTDYRLEMNDIIMRMETGPNGLVSKNTLNMRRNRFRTAINASSWNDCRTYPPRNDLDIVRQLTADQICLNTNMHVDRASGRLLKPVFDNIRCQAVSQTGWIDSGLPMDIFLAGVITTIPTRRMVGILTLTDRVQTLAQILGHGNAWDNYKLLSRDDAPPWWNDRTRDRGGDQGRRIDEIDGLTHEEFMQGAIGSSNDIGIAKRAKTRGWPV